MPELPDVEQLRSYCQHTPVCGGELEKIGGARRSARYCPTCQKS